MSYPIPRVVEEIDGDGHRMLVGERLLVLDARVVQNGFCATWRSYSRYLGDNIKLERDVLIGSWKDGMEICLDVTSTGSFCHETAYRKLARITMELEISCE